MIRAIGTKEEKSRVSFPSITFSEDDPILKNYNGDDPLIITADVGITHIHRIYVDGRSSTKIMYEHCFEQLTSKEKEAIRPSATPLVGFAGQISWPLELITMPITIYDYHGHTSQKIVVDFMIIRSHSPYNVILGRPELMKLGAITSTLHSLMKLQTEKGIAIKIESLEGFKLKCFLDAYKGNHRIRMAKEDEEKASIHTKQATFYYKKMSFRLKNVGATYQRLMDNVFASQLGRDMEIYVDDMTEEMCKNLYTLSVEHCKGQREYDAKTSQKSNEPAWTLFMNEASNIEGLGAWLILTDLDG
uniref:Reverse transcriptase domain-containing protein n=1 Tax=Tanacetum cinerariifolium TaxID=118510 RepID=A0A6L2MEP5_TANCI|nr:reverse transcriptase domain-containing protein [Tanacetum cinerariifolium]